MSRLCDVYIMTGRNGIFYTGITNNLISRVIQHRSGESEYTGRYRLDRLVYFESTNDVREAIAREKQIKPWRREKMIALIKRINARFLDLGETVLGLPALQPGAWPREVSQASRRKPTFSHDRPLHSVPARRGLRSG
jgi:putative endonuclease